MVTATSFSVEAIRKEFPILATRLGDKPLVYLDNAATAQKPQVTLDAMDEFWRTSNANIHRGVHHLSQMATAQFDTARETVRRFLGARHAHECLFTKGCTEGINLVAQSYARPRLKPADEILLSTMEHHSNIVPWQLVAEQTGAIVRPIPINDDGEIDLAAYGRLLNERTKIVGLVHISNSLGTINPIKAMIAQAHAAGAVVLIDGAQAGPHLPIDVQDLDADFYTLSCHKIYAPTGMGVLYGKEALLEAMPPYHGGGDMIRTVSFEGSTFAGLPNKFEAGTPNVGGVVGLGATLKWLMALDREEVERHEAELVGYAETLLSDIPGVRLIGKARQKAAIVSFVMDTAHPHDIGTVLDAEGIAIRAGHHCCMPVMERLGVPATARASFGLYNTREEVEALARGVQKVKEIFG
ncbi:MAG: cysteine desulfurase [Fimbriimonas ginsengisoli]|uniref:cysteine desulfurase n=1 Tax=Fimbriimonas ginsengisoli TaxID=1005039 RepID=A0A931LRW3_FIMGI|nr:cysteine desulfurase [Fimbriimonas ginsengisoli]